MRLLFTVDVELEPQPPERTATLREELENALSDAVTWKDGVVPKSVRVQQVAGEERPLDVV